MQNQGLLAITFFEAIAFSILLVLYLLLDRGRPARFFRFWIAGWVGQTLWSGLLVFSLSVQGNMSRVMALEAHLSWESHLVASRGGFGSIHLAGGCGLPLFWPLISLGWIVLARGGAPYARLPRPAGCAGLRRFSNVLF